MTARFPNTRVRIECVLCAVLLMAFAAGCLSNDRPHRTERDDSNVSATRSEKELGPVRLIVEVQPDKPRLSDEPQLTLTIRAPRGIRIEKPPFGEALGEFLIRDFFEPLPETDDDIEITRQIYTLEPMRAGNLTIAPIAVVWWDERPDGDQKSHTVESEALTLEVSTMLADEAPSLANLAVRLAPRRCPPQRARSDGGYSAPWLASDCCRRSFGGSDVAAGRQKNPNNLRRNSPGWNSRESSSKTWRPPISKPSTLN